MVNPLISRVIAYLPSACLFLSVRYGKWPIPWQRWWCGYFFSLATLNHSYIRWITIDSSGLVHPHYEWTDPAYPTYDWWKQSLFNYQLCPQKRCRKVFLRSRVNDVPSITSRLSVFIYIYIYIYLGLVLHGNLRIWTPAKYAKNAGCNGMFDGISSRDECGNLLHSKAVSHMSHLLICNKIGWWLMLVVYVAKHWLG